MIKKYAKEAMKLHLTFEQ